MKLTVPWITEDELSEVAQVLESGYLTQGPKAAEFAALVARLVGASRGLATSSCTTALHLTLAGLGVGPRDEVILPDFTFPATANVVIQLGATPVLVDIHPETFTIRSDDIEANVTERTKAIMPVHAFGLCADMAPIADIGRSHGIAVIEDAACAIGATYQGRNAGSLGDVGCFSFHPRKVITTGEGGVITTSDETLADRLALLASHGAMKGPLFLSFEEAGFNYRMSDINAAVGIAQLRKLNSALENRRQLASTYRDFLGDNVGVRLPIEPEGYRHTFQSFVIILDDHFNRDEVIGRMRQAGIETTLGTYSLQAQPYFKREFGPCLPPLPGSERAYMQSLTLPLFPTMTVDDCERVSMTLAQTLRSM